MSIAPDVDWQSVQTGDFTASAGKGYFVNTTSAAVEVTLVPPIIEKLSTIESAVVDPVSPVIVSYKII